MTDQGRIELLYHTGIIQSTVLGAIAGIADRVRGVAPSCGHFPKNPTDKRTEEALARRHHSTKTIYYHTVAPSPCARPTGARGSLPHHSEEAVSGPYSHGFTKNSIIVCLVREYRNCLAEFEFCKLTGQKPRQLPHAQFLAGLQPHAAKNQTTPDTYSSCEGWGGNRIINPCESLHAGSTSQRHLVVLRCTAVITAVDQSAPGLLFSIRWHWHRRCRVFGCKQIEQTPTNHGHSPTTKKSKKSRLPPLRRQAPVLPSNLRQLGLRVHAKAG